MGFQPCIHTTQRQRCELQLPAAASTCHVVLFSRTFFFQKYLALRRRTGLSRGSEILAGCFALCVSVCLAPSQCVEEGSVVQKSERQHCHWEFACMTVPGSNCKAFFSTAAVSLCCFFCFVLFVFFHYSTCLSLSILLKTITAGAAPTNEDHSFYIRHSWRQSLSLRNWTMSQGDLK